MQLFCSNNFLMSHITEIQLDNIADALAGCGYLVMDNFLPDNLLKALITHVNSLDQITFNTAGIGRKKNFQLQESVRSDKIHWLDADSPTTAELLHVMESLRIGLNRRLFLGLVDYESHFAIYAKGTFYKKHKDAFSGQILLGQSNRVVSTVLYLNESWQTNNGGELIIYSEDSEQVLEKILPERGRMVVFLSEKFPHEVLLATRERNSIAGWFRART